MSGSSSSERQQQQGDRGRSALVWVVELAGAPLGAEGAGPDGLKMDTELS